MIKWLKQLSEWFQLIVLSVIDGVQELTDALKYHRCTSNPTTLFAIGFVLGCAAAVGLALMTPEKPVMIVQVPFK